MARKKKRPGSPEGEPVYLAVGFLRRAHGVAGEMLMDIHTDFPERLKPGRVLYLGPSREGITLASVRPHGAAVLVKFAGLDTPEALGRLRNQWAFVRSSEAAPLPAGRLFKHELIGMDVVGEDDRLLGKIHEVIETGANDVFVVRPAYGPDLLLPAIPSVILDIRKEQRVVRVHLLDGLLEAGRVPRRQE